MIPQFNRPARKHSPMNRRRHIRLDGPKGARLRGAPSFFAVG
ncbi:MAG TPA: hypothetical protein VEB67_01935 [Nitrososphaerales archaeon]|nr:hypothetical protein [Nitrososphaerales archaeon]